MRSYERIRNGQQKIRASIRKAELLEKFRSVCSPHIVRDTRRRHGTLAFSGQVARSCHQQNRS